MSKEWFSLFCQEILKPENSNESLYSYKVELFKRCDTNEVSYFIDEASCTRPDRESTFFMIGVVIAKALFDKIPLNLCLNR